MPSVATQTAPPWLHDEGGGAPSCWAHVVPGSPREPVSLIASWGADLVLSELMRPSWFGRPVRRSLAGRPKKPGMIFAHRGAQTDGGQIFSEIRAPTSAAAPGAPLHREENDSADGGSQKDTSSGAASGAMAASSSNPVAICSFFARRPRVVRACWRMHGVPW